VLHQSRPPNQLLVLDDASTDDTSDVVACMGAAAEYHRFEFCSAQRTRNAGLALAKSELILFLDADDYLAPDALAQLEQPFLRHPELKMAYGDLVPFGDTEAIRRRGKGDLWVADEFSRARLTFQNYIQTSALLRRAGFQGFDPRINRGQEWDAWLGFLDSEDDAVHVPVPILHHRIHELSLTRKTSELVERLKVLLKHDIFEFRLLECGDSDRTPGHLNRRRMIIFCHGSAATDAASTIAMARKLGLCGTLVFLATGEQRSATRPMAVQGAGSRLSIRYSEASGLEVALRQNIVSLGDPFLEFVAFVSAPTQLARMKYLATDRGELMAFTVTDKDEILAGRELEQLSPLALSRSAARYLLYLPPTSDTGAAAKARWTFGRWFERNLKWRWVATSKVSSRA
jgi:hypothetical protein